MNTTKLVIRRLEQAKEKVSFSLRALGPLRKVGLLFNGDQADGMNLPPSSFKRKIINVTATFDGKPMDKDEYVAWCRKHTADEVRVVYDNSIAALKESK